MTPLNEEQKNIKCRKRGRKIIQTHVSLRRVNYSVNRLSINNTHETNVI